MKQVLTSIFIYFAITCCYAQHEYDISNIPENLRANANTIVRNEQMLFTLQGIDKASLKVDKTVTIMNKEGIKDAGIFVYYDKFRRIKSIRGEIYDSKGEHVKKIKQENIYDMSPFAGYESFDDNRLKVIDLDYQVFPFTIQYSYEINFIGLLYYPSWVLYDDYNVSIEKSIFQVAVPGSDENIPSTSEESEIPFRYIELNGVSKSEIKYEDSKIIYSWRESNLEAIVEEKYSPKIEEISPAVMLAPIKFIFGGVEGSFESWNEFGKWFYKLNEGRNNLSEEAKIKVREMVKNENSTVDKIKLIYEFLQNNTRYVSIQLGIGGWQPFEADFVYNNGYGDCKALSNYMMSMLEVIDIKSNYVLVRAGKENQYLVPEFLIDQFNHAFLMVPLETDTIWLECTSQHVPFNYHGSFTDDRDVLMIKDNGAELIHTPGYGINENVRKRDIEVKIDNNGNANILLSTKYKGQFYDDKSFTLLYDQAKKKDLLYKSIQLPNFTIKDFKYVESKSENPSIDEKIQMTVPAYGKKIGDKLTLKLNILSSFDDLPPKGVDRKSDILIPRPFLQHDLITYELPADFRTLYKPEDKEIDSKFGNYSIKVEVVGNKIFYERKFGLKKNRYAPNDYESFVKFLRNVHKVDKEKLLVIKGT